MSSLDFGFWGRDERSSLRWLAAAQGAVCQVIYLSVDRAAQLERVQHRVAGARHETFAVTLGSEGRDPLAVVPGLTGETIVGDDSERPDPRGSAP